MALHTFAGGEMLPNGDIVLGCSCDAWFQGTPEEAKAAYRDHIHEPALTKEAGE